MGRNYYGGTVLLLIVLGCAWAALDWKSTGHDVVIALMIMLLVCIRYGFAVGYCSCAALP